MIGITGLKTYGGQNMRAGFYAGFLAASLILPGCASSPQYIPETLQGLPRIELAMVEIDLTVEGLMIDGAAVDGNSVALAGGQHEFRYAAEAVTWEYIQEDLNLIKQGFWDADGDGLYQEVKYPKTRADMRNTKQRYEWREFAGSVVLPAGGRYRLSGLHKDHFENQDRLQKGSLGNNSN